MPSHGVLGCEEIFDIPGLALDKVYFPSTSYSPIIQGGPLKSGLTLNLHSSLIIKAPTFIL